MSLKDNLVSSAISIAKDKLQGEKTTERTSAGSAILRFFITAIWVFITLIATCVAGTGMTVGAMANFLGDEGGKALCFLAIVLCFAIFLITFLVPYLRKKGTLTRWCGIIALGDAVWWIYLLFTL